MIVMKILYDWVIILNTMLVTCFYREKPILCQKFHHLKLFQVEEQRAKRIGGAEASSIDLRRDVDLRRDAVYTVDKAYSQDRKGKFEHIQRITNHRLG